MTPIFKTRCKNEREFRKTCKEYIDCNGFVITSDYNSSKKIICLKNPKSGSLHVVYY